MENVKGFCIFMENLSICTFKSLYFNLLTGCVITKDTRQAQGAKHVDIKTKLPIWS